MTEIFFSDGVEPTRPGCNNKSCLKAILEVPATKLGQFVGKLSGFFTCQQPVKRCGAVGVVEVPSSQVKHSEIYGGIRVGNDRKTTKKTTGDFVKMNQKMVECG